VKAVITSTQASLSLGAVRFLVLGLVAAAVLINYLDRAVLGIAAPAIQAEFALSPVLMGVVFSAFSWSYFAAQIPSGILLDRFGVRLAYRLALIGWSLATLLHGLARGFFSLVGLRIVLGLTEAPCFPANSNIVAAWFPREERARAIGIYTAAEYVGLGFLTPLLFWIVGAWGWRALFVVAGGIGLLFAVFWWRRYRDPHESGELSASERNFILAGGGTVNRPPAQAFSFAVLRALFRDRQMWGLCIGQFSVYSTFVFFLTWFPTYLATERHMTWINVGFFTALPYVAGFFGILFAGFLSDALLRRDCSLDTARKLPVIMGLLLASTIILANYLESDIAVIAILSLSFFAQAMSSSGWAVISEVAPPGQIGLIGGLFSASANLSGIVTPLVIGGIVQKTGSFVDALIFVGVVAAIGALSWIFLIGKIHRIEIS
jgi:ACS family D-galactonate transporter-like MFS transporter